MSIQLVFIVSCLFTRSAFGTSPDKNELCLCRASQSADPIKIVATVAKYTSNYGLFTKIPHLEGEEVFGSTKSKADLPPGSEAGSH